MGTLTLMKRWWSVAAVSLVALAACSAEVVVREVAAPSSTPTAASTETSTETSTQSSTETSAESLPLVGGGTFDLTQLDQGPLALWFWAPG